jgi:hypothetical protein
MPDLLTRRGARTVSKTLDGVAGLFYAKNDPEGNIRRAKVLGLSDELALDFATTMDRMADHVEKVAVANYPDSENPHIAATEVDKIPAQDADPEVAGVTTTSGGNTDEAPASDDQNKPETYMGMGDRRQGSDKTATPEWTQAPINETGLSVEPAGAAPPHWDPNYIGDKRPGPFLQEADELYMRGEFTQQEFQELRDKQQAGVLPGVDRFASLDTKLAALDDAELSLDKLAALGAEFRSITADSLSRMPGLSPMQLRATQDRIVQIRQEMAIVHRQYEEALKQLSGLEKEEKAGIATLKKAANAMTEKGKYLSETENSLLQFTAYLTTKVPGIEQMIARDDEVKAGTKAGDFFGRIASRLGDAIAKDVELIWSSCKDDLTYSRMVIRGLKVTAKTAGMKQASMKEAGIAELVVSFRDWLSGGKDSLVARLIDWTKDITSWARGFLVRTKIVGAATKDIKAMLADAEKEIDGAFKFAKVSSSPEGEASSGLPSGEDRFAFLTQL